MRGCSRQAASDNLLRQRHNSFCNCACIKIISCCQDICNKLSAPILQFYDDVFGFLPDALAEFPDLIPKTAVDLFQFFRAQFNHIIIRMHFLFSSSMVAAALFPPPLCFPAPGPAPAFVYTRSRRGWQYDACPLLSFPSRLWICTICVL